MNRFVDKARNRITELCLLEEDRSRSPGRKAQRAGEIKEMVAQFDQDLANVIRVLRMRGITRRYLLDDIYIDVPREQLRRRDGEGRDGPEVTTEVLFSDHSPTDCFERLAAVLD